MRSVFISKWVSITKRGGRGWSVNLPNIWRGITDGKEGPEQWARGPQNVNTILYYFLFEWIFPNHSLIPVIILWKFKKTGIRRGVSQFYGANLVLTENFFPMNFLWFFLSPLYCREVEAGNHIRNNFLSWNFIAQTLSWKRPKKAKIWFFTQFLSIKFVKEIIF